MNLNALAKKAANGTAPTAYGGAMEVEDMIRFVLFHGSAAADCHNERTGKPIHEHG